MLIGGQRSRSIPIQIEGTQTDLADGDREPEHGPSPGIDRRPGERRPTKLHRVRQVGLGDRAALPVRIHTRAFTQRVLQLLDQRADVVGGAQRSLRTVIGEQHDSGAAHLGDLRTHRTEPSRRTTRTTVAQPSQDANHPIVRHHTPPAVDGVLDPARILACIATSHRRGEAHSGVQIRRVSRDGDTIMPDPGGADAPAATSAICRRSGATSRRPSGRTSTSESSRRPSCGPRQRNRLIDLVWRDGPPDEERAVVAGGSVSRWVAAHTCGNATVSLETPAIPHP